jgi:hypothetical protein
MLRAPQRLDAVDVPVSALDKHGRSADATTGETIAAPTGERSISGPRFLIGLRGAATAYVASANTSISLTFGM